MFKKSLTVCLSIFLVSVASAQTTDITIVGEVERNVTAEVYVGNVLICEKTAHFATRTITCHTTIAGTQAVLTLRTISSNGDVWSGCDHWSDDGSSQETCTLYLNGNPRQVNFYTTEDEIDE